MKRYARPVFSLLFLILLLEIGARGIWFQNHAPDPSGLHHLVRKARKWVPVWFGGAAGSTLRRRAWEASFLERGLDPPPGPRNGWEGPNKPKNRDCAPLVYCEAEESRPGYVVVDANGFQYAGPRDAPSRVLIVGGSVAYGSQASREDATYFSQLAALLLARGIPTRIAVLAAGAWTSGDDLGAFVLRGSLADSDFVVFLNGLNDLTIPKHLPPTIRVDTYARNMAIAREVALLRGVRLIYALQPYPDEKPHKSPLDERILYLSHHKRRDLATEVRQLSYQRTREILAGLTRPGESWFVDCSRALDGDGATTFVDYWHFSDPGQKLLASCLAEGIAPILQEARTDPDAPQRSNSIQSRRSRRTAR